MLELSDAATFSERVLRFLLVHEAENNLIVSSTLTLAKASARAPRFSFYLVERAGKIVAAALNSPERRLLLSQCEEEEARFLGDHLRQRGAKVKGALGPSACAHSFSQAFMAPAVINESHLNHVQKILRLEKLNERGTVHGRMRAAGSKDHALLLNWSRQFVSESQIDESFEQTEMLVQKYLEARKFYLWDDGRAVAMAGHGGNTPNGVRVNMVYTDKPFRGRGYAGSLVYVLSRRLLNEGHRFCFLFTDVTNPIANHIYEKMGYRSVCEFSEYGFSVKITG